MSNSTTISSATAYRVDIFYNCNDSRCSIGVSTSISHGERYVLSPISLQLKVKTLILVDTIPQLSVEPSLISLAEIELVRCHQVEP